MGDIGETCGTVVGLILKIKKVYDTYKENKIVLDELELHVRHSKELIDSIPRKDYRILSKAISDMREEMNLMMKVMDKLRWRNRAYKLAFSVDISKDLQKMNDSLKWANEKLGNAMAARTMNATDKIQETANNIQNTTDQTNHMILDLQTIVIDMSKNISKQSTNINEIKFSELQDKHLIHSGIQGREIYSCIYHGERVAVKMLGANLTEEVHKLNFKKEIRNASFHSTKYIVQVYGACMEPSHLAIIMELMEGSLSDLLYKHKKNLSWEDKKDVALSVAIGLQCLHKANVFHRNLSSRHILYSRKNDYKVADLSLAKLASDPKSQNTGDEARGQVAYIAPELFKSLKYSTKSDVKVKLIKIIYAFGVVLWELASDTPPRDNLSRDKIMQEVLAGNRETIPASTPDDWAKLIRECWSQEPDERPDIEEVKSAIENMV